MSSQSSSQETSTPVRRSMSGGAWVLALAPLILLGVVLAYLVVTGGGLTELAGPPVEQVSIQRITLPDAGVIQVEVVNDGPQEVTIPQVQVDDAYFYHHPPSRTGDLYDPLPVGEGRSA